MIDDQKVLGLILARGGSKGLPGKNVKPFAGRAMIGWTIQNGLDSRSIDRVVVSTDNEDIARVARDEGADVPFLRPAELATDESPTIDAVMHALDQLPSYAHVVLMQPTSPLRHVEDVEAVIGLALRRGAPAAVSVTSSKTHPNWTVTLDSQTDQIRHFIQSDVIGRRQDLEPVYRYNGAVYYARVDWLRKKGSFFVPGVVGYPMSEARSYDIDTELDFILAEAIKEKLGL